MAKKHRKENILQFELSGLGLLTLSALALGRLGWVGRFLDVAAIYLAGSWSFLVPLFVAYGALYMMVKRSVFPWDNRHMGMLVILISLLTLVEFDFYQFLGQYYPNEPIPLFHASLLAMNDMRNQVLAGAPSGGTPGRVGGGLIGYAFFMLLKSLFGLFGLLVVLSVLALVGLLLVFQMSLVAVVQRGSRWVERQLEALWRGCKQYITLLFGPERPRENRGRGKKDKANSEPKPKRSRKNAEDALIVDAEWSHAHAEEFDEPNTAPVVHDFAARQPAHAESRHEPEVDAGKPTLSQVGNQLVMRYPEPKHRDKPIAPPPTTEKKKPMEEYSVGPPVHDENYQLPSIGLFRPADARKSGVNLRDVQENARKLEKTLESFGVQAKVLEISRGPTVTRYEIQPATGVKVSRIVNLTDDIALALAARDIRIEAPVPGKPVVGIEVPNDEIAVVTLREVLEAAEFVNGGSRLSMALGRDISGQAIVGNLQKMPHLLVAGATGSGKSVCINGMIASILMKAKPHEVKLLMIDPKMVELSGYNGIPHLLAPVVTDPRKAAFALKRVIEEMENRYQSFAERGARDIERYNELISREGADPLPYIVVIVDELADLMMVAPGEVEDAICRIAQMARAAGIHLIVATQRPSVDVITGVIKANIPSRIAFSVSSMADSRTILDGGGAEKLLGRGDMLYLPVGASKPVRVQGAFVSEEEIEKLVDYVKSQQNVVYTVDLNTGVEESNSGPSSDLDDLFPDAVDLVVDAGQASVSMIQRRFRVGYSRAARIVDQMELQGLVGPFEGSKPREVTVTAEEWATLRHSYIQHRSAAE
ncbi:DNA translocase FtsK [Alicyclobacillus ferrooxydans]|uniref:Cell division protein FtsK n=1 Tax=Alicyclobacillus ferrooxydans TaxID=471514 RepID=A0A0N8PMW3_9BACL|nr:DNA translocase FtsK [Alicyclobacillus ferrooxydans]KPV39845.1 cell division protein FtsK [Alicyclobacillus ferrooxydans]